MKLKLSQYTPRKVEETFITPKVTTSTRNITLEYLPEIYLNSDAIHVMKNDTLPEIFLETKVALTRRRTKENIMLTLQRIMILPEKESNKKVKTLHVMKNMF